MEVVVVRSGEVGGVERGGGKGAGRRARGAGRGAGYPMLSKLLFT